MKPPVGNGRNYIVKWGGDEKCRGRMIGIWNILNNLKVAYGVRIPELGWGLKGVEKTKEGLVGEATRSF